MERIRIDNFNAGIIEAQEPDRIPDNALVDVVNLEYNNSNVLTARQTIAVYALSGWLESQGITTTQLYVWYAPVMPETASGSEVYFVYDNSSLYVVWLTDSGWVKNEISITGVEYSGEITFANSNDRIIIVDGTNKTHFVMFDKDGELVSGVFEYPAPKNKIVISPITEWNSDLFETNLAGDYIFGEGEASSSDYLGDCGAYQYVYCYADRWGNLSNPSPVSNTYYIDYFKLDDSSKDEQKVDRIYLTNMAIPDGIDDNTRENIEEFYIYPAIVPLDIVSALFPFMRYSVTAVVAFITPATPAPGDKACVVVIP